MENMEEPRGCFHGTFFGELVYQMEWSWLGRTLPSLPHHFNTSLERMINVSPSARGVSIFPKIKLIYCSTDSATCQIKQSNIDQRGNKEKRGMES